MLFAQRANYSSCVPFVCPFSCGGGHVDLLPGVLSRGVVVRTRDGRMTSPSSMEAAKMQIICAKIDDLN